MGGTPRTGPARRSAWLWPLALTGLLAASACANIAFMVVATRDPSFAVEPDYYAKALAWDRTMAQEEHNRALGWSLAVSAEPALRPGRLRLVVRLGDASGAAIDGAVVTVEALHGARAAEIIRGAFAPAGSGTYEADLPLRRAGLWELRFRVSRGDDVFTERVSRDLPGAS